MALFDVYDGDERLGSRMLASDADLMIEGLKDGTFWSYRGDTKKRENVKKVRHQPVNKK